MGYAILVPHHHLIFHDAAVFKQFLIHRHMMSRRLLRRETQHRLADHLFPAHSQPGQERGVAAQVKALDVFVIHGGGNRIEDVGEQHLLRARRQFDAFALGNIAEHPHHAEDFSTRAEDRAQPAFGPQLVLMSVSQAQNIRHADRLPRQGLAEQGFQTEVGGAREGLEKRGVQGGRLRDAGQHHHGIIPNPAVPLGIVHDHPIGRAGGQLRAPPVRQGRARAAPPETGQNAAHSGYERHQKIRLHHKRKTTPRSPSAGGHAWKRGSRGFIAGQTAGFSW